MPPIPPPRPRIGQTHWARLYTLLCILLLTITAHAGEPTATPLPRLEVGMHTAIIWRIASDGQGRWAVTASEDKTARLWEVASGKLLGVLRPPQGEGNEGKLFAVAMSPDGRQIAVAGWTGWDWEGKHSIYLYQHDPQQHTLRLARRLSGLPNVVSHLAFSADGRWLAAGLGRNNGVRVFDAASGQLTGQDASYGADCYSVAFRPVSGSQPLELLTSSYDGLLRLHPVDTQGRLGAPRVQRAPGGGQQPFAARFSPDGQRIAVGFDDSTVVQVLDAHDLRELFRPERQGVDNGDLSKVAWSADGRSLVAAGRWQVQGQRTMRRWSAQDGRRLTDTPLAANTVMDLAPLPQGGWLFAAQDPTWGVLDGQGAVPRRQDAQQADLRDQYDQFQLSADGQQLRFGFAPWGKQPYVFDLSRRQLHSAAANEPDLHAARTHTETLKVENWRNNTQPRLNGQPIQLKPYETARSLAIDANGKGFVLGADWRLRGYQRDGTQQWEKPVPGVAWAVNQSQDGRWVVAGYGDGTIRWHRREDGQEVLALFAHRDGKRWVLWTPEGFYAASEGGEALFGYHLNRGKDQDGEFVSAGQLSELFNRPALLSQRLSPEGDALMAEAVKQLGTVDEVLAHAHSLPPILTVEAPSGQRVEGDREVTVTVRLQDQGGGIGPVKIFVDGQEVSGRQAAATEGVTSRQRYALTLPLAPGEHQLAFQATSVRGVAGPRTAPLPARVRQAEPSTLHILSIGVQNYPSASGQRPLGYSAQDAQAVAEAIARRAKPVFSHVAEPVVLTEQNASLAGIRQAFDQLKTRMQPQDTLVIFLAGHGRVDAGSYRFLPWDYRPGSAGLSEANLFSMLQQSPQRTVLLIDTCDAGGMVEMLAGAYERMNRQRQRPVIGASRKGEFAREGYQNHGVFTAALLNVLERPQGEQLTVMELYPQTKRRVEEFSKKLPGNYLQTVQGYVGNGEFPLVWR